MRTNHRTIGTIAATLALLGLGACRNSEKAPYEGKRDTLATSTTPAGETAWGLVDQPDGGRREYPQITVDHGLRNHLAFGEPVVEQREIMSVTVPCRLLADRSEFSRVQYRFIFLKDNGTPLRDQPDWRFMRLEARQQVFLRMSSTDTASSWRLEVRGAR